MLPLNKRLSHIYAGGTLSSGSKYMYINAWPQIDAGYQPGAWLANIHVYVAYVMGMVNRTRAVMCSFWRRTTCLSYTDVSRVGSSCSQNFQKIPPYIHN